MVLKKNGIIVQTYEPWYSNKKIAIAIDSSKSNTAIIVGDVYGNVLDDYEIDGKSDKDVTVLSWNQRKELKKLFEGAKIQLVGIENIITKKSDTKGKDNPLDIHMSRWKITHIFDSLICFFQDNHNINPELVNQWDWKVDTLPEEYRKRDHKKGSLDYQKAIGSKYAYRSDDVTDAYCIYQFLAREHGYKNIKEIEEPCSADKQYNCGIYPTSTNVPPNAKQFVFNMDLTFKQNCDTMVFNTLYSDVYCYARIPVSYLSIEDIYKYAKGNKHQLHQSEVFVFCKIKE